MPMNKLDKARDALDGFERGFGSETSAASDSRLLNELATGMGLLDEVANEGTSQSQVAVDIGNACFKKTCELISTRLRRGPETVENLKMLGSVLKELNSHGFVDARALLSLQAKALGQITHRYLQFQFPDETDEMKEFNQQLFKQGDKVLAFLEEQEKNKMQKFGTRKYGDYRDYKVPTIFPVFEECEPDEPDDAA